MDRAESDLRDDSPLPADGSPVIKQSKNKRDVIAFLFLGLCNNFCYGIMLSAAFDILSDQDKPHLSTTISPIYPTTTSASMLPSSNLTTAEPLNYKDCHKVSTGAVLLADVLPSLIIKMTIPLYFEYVSYNLMVVISIGLAAASLILVSFSKTLTVSLIGVACASSSSGVGEFLFLSLSSYFDKSVMVGYSSGTGVSGVLFSLTYVLLTSVLGISPREAILIVLVVPAFQFIVYFFLLTKRPKRKSSRSKDGLNEALIDNTINSPQSNLPEDELIEPLTDHIINSPQSDGPKDGPNESLIENTINSPQSNRQLSAKEKIRHIKPLFKYMIPLTVVYMAEYLINQGLFELIYFPTLSWLNHDDQYRWYQLLYQVGVFISRSSIALFTIKYIWVMSVLQCAVFVFLLTVAMYHYLPSIWIVFATIAFEGLLGGFTFANTFYRMLIEVKEEYKEFAMGLTSISVSFGITIAGLISIPLHNTLCK